MPRSSARAWRSSVRRAASLSCEKLHSYGYEMKSSLRGRMTATAPGAAASSSDASAWSISRWPETRESSSPDVRNASQSAAADSWICRCRTPSRRKTKPEGSRNEAGSIDDPSVGRIGLLGDGGLLRRVVIATDLVPRVADRAPEEERDGEDARQDDLEEHAGRSRIDIRQKWHGSAASVMVKRMVTPQRRDGYLSRPGVDVTTLPLHPVLATAYPVVFLFAVNVSDQVTVGPLWRPLAISIAGGIGAIVIGRLVTG